MLRVDYRGGRVIVRHGGVLRRLTGLALIAAGLGLALLWLRAPSASSVVAPALGALAALGGLRLLSSPRKLVVDRDQGEIRETRGGRRHPLRHLGAVRLDVEWDSDAVDSFHVRLVVAGQGIDVIDHIDEAEMRRQAVALARFLGVVLEDNVTGARHAPALLGETLRARLRRQGGPPATPAPAPLEPRGRDRGTSDGKVWVEIPHRRGDHGAAILVSVGVTVVLVAASLHPRLLGDGRSHLSTTERVLGALVLGCFYPVIFLAKALWARGWHTVVEADGEALVVTVRGRILSHRVRLPAGEITELCVQGGSGLLVAISPTQVVRFGDTLSLAERQWLLDRLLRALA